MAVQKKKIIAIDVNVFNVRTHVSDAMITERVKKNWRSLH
jgi:hypothetical protein